MCEYKHQVDYRQRKPMKGGVRLEVLLTPEELAIVDALAARMEGGRATVLKRALAAYAKQQGVGDE